MRYRFFQILFTTTAFIFIQDISIKAQESIKLSLASCREMALSQSESLQQAEHKYEQSRLDRKIANTAFLPKFDASATGTYVFPDIDMMGMDLRMRGMYMAGITLTQPLYAGGKIMTGKKLSKLGESIAAEQKRMTMMDVLVEADNAYWTLIAVRQKVKMLDSYKEQMDSLYSQVKTAVGAGLSTENELLRIEASRSDILYQIQKAKNGEDLCRMSLCRITGIDSNAELELTDTTIHVNEPGLLTADINERPELNLLKHQMDATQKQIQMSRANMLPTVGLVAGYTYYGNIKLNSMVDAGNGTMVPYSQEFRDGLGAVMLSINIPIFEWGANLKKVKKAKLDFKNAELELSKTNNKYNVSMALLTDLLDAQSQWKQAKSNLIEAQTQYKIYETEYLRATGRLNQDFSPDYQ